MLVVEIAILIIVAVGLIQIRSLLREMNDKLDGLSIPDGCDEAEDLEDYSVPLYDGYHEANRDGEPICPKCKTVLPGPPVPVED